MIFEFFIHTENSYRKYKGTHKLNPFKTLALFSLIGMAACENIPDGIVDTKYSDTKILNVDAPSTFAFNGTDSMLVTKINFENSESISSVWASVKSLDGRLTVTSKTELKDDGNITVNGDDAANDKIYSAKIAMGLTKPSGKYYVDFFVEDNVNPAPNNVSKVASHVFEFLNNTMQENYAPVISNLVMPSGFNIEETYIFTVNAADQNGLFDIKEVFFRVFQPDGTVIEDTKNNRDYFRMDDSGNFQNYGDQTANDGIYSFKITFHDNAMRGTWHFEFYARDKKEVLSNKIDHDVNIN